jgi:hypothetical protein
VSRPVRARERQQHAVLINGLSKEVRYRPVSCCKRVDDTFGSASSRVFIFLSEFSGKDIPYDKTMTTYTVVSWMRA